MCFSPSLLAPALVRVPLVFIVRVQSLSVFVHCTLRSVLCLVYTSVCAVIAQAAAEEPFFNRTEELKCLKRHLFSPPSRNGITVVVGPMSSGKTALVQEFMKELSKELKEGKSQQAPRLKQPLYINCREEDVSTPDSFASTLLSATVSAGEQIKGAMADVALAILSGLSGGLTQGNETADLKLVSVAEIIGKLKAQPETPIASVLSSFQKALKRTFDCSAASPRPSIIIDEANNFTIWSANYPEELKTLLNFFVALTKEKNLAHVFLMTSDYAFISWMEKGEHIVFSGPNAAVM